MLRIYKHLKTKSMNYQSVDALLKGKNFGVFKNAKEFLSINSFYEGTLKKFSITFRNPHTNDVATRFAIKTTSEKKVLKIIKEEGFILQE